MFKKITVDEMSRLITSDNPTWNEDAILEKAKEYLANCDERLEEPLYHYIQTGETQNLRYGDFSILQIRALQPGRTYLTAVLMMDAYMKDPVAGTAKIFRR